METTKCDYRIFPGTIGLQELPNYIIINLVKNWLCTEYKLTMDEISSTIRKNENTEPRHIFIYLLRKLSHNRITLKQIGKMISKDHSTVISANKKIVGWMETDAKFKKKINAIETKIACQL